MWIPLPKRPRHRSAMPARSYCACPRRFTVTGARGPHNVAGGCQAQTVGVQRGFFQLQPVRWQLVPASTPERESLFLPQCLQAVAAAGISGRAGLPPRKLERVDIRLTVERHGGEIARNGDVSQHGTGQLVGGWPQRMGGPPAQAGQVRTKANLGGSCRCARLHPQLAGPKR